MPLTAAQLQVLVTADTLPAQASLGAMNERVATSHAMFGGMLSQIGSFVAGQVIFALLARAVMELEMQVKDAAAKTSDWDDKLTQLNAVLTSTHSVAGWTSDAAIKLADSLSQVTRYNNIAVLSVENLLLTFTAIGKDIMPQATETVLNMATALKEDTKSAAIQLGKALQDPVLGMTALRRVGVNFNAEQKKMVENWVAHGEKAKAVAFILNELTTEFGGSAKAAGTDMAGKLAILNNQFDVIKETIGNAMIPVLSSLLEHLIPVFTMIANGLPGALKTIGDIFQAVGYQVDMFRLAGIEPMHVAMKSVQQTMQSSFLPAFAGLQEFITSWVIPTVQMLAYWFESKIMPIILTVAGVIMTDFVPTIEMLAEKIMSKLMPPLMRIIADIMPALIPLFKALGWIFTNVVGPALGFLIDQLGNVLDGLAAVADALNWIFSNLNKLPAGLKVAQQQLHQMHIPGFAAGGITPGGLAVVGERGPEIVSLPGGSRVYPNGTGPSVGGGMQASTFIIQLDGRVIAQQTLKHAPGVIRLATGARNF